MIKENLGKISITPKGQWVAGSYERLDLVTNAGSSYLSLKDNNFSALNTADWMLVAEKGDAFEYSDFTPEQLEALKVKGDTFLYSDFTPAQIAELQQPAADAIASIQAVELSVEKAEALRVQAEIDRQTNTGTAIQNAGTATQNASDAAILANTKAVLADTAATNANTKAGLADTAATNADNARLAIRDDLALKVDKSAVKQTTGTSETDVMSQKAVTTIADLVPALQPLQTVANKNQYYPIIENNAGLIVGKHQTAYWNGSAWVADNSFGMGNLALLNNTGANTNGVGSFALLNNTGGYVNGVGSSALQNNTGGYVNGVGISALQNNTGANTNGVGSSALQNNTGGYANGVGSSALQNNTGLNSNGMGSVALQNNTGMLSNGFGYYILLNNTGANANCMGAYALTYNQKANNSAFGHNAYSAFLDNTAGNKSADSTAVDITLERITITAHGFGATNAIVNIKYASTTGTAIGGLGVGTVYQVKIIDANTIEFVTGATKRNLTSQGAGTHTFTPQFAYENTTCLGANTYPNKDNQVVLGDTAVDTVKMGGTSRTIASATATGVKGEWCWDSDYIYVCIATNTWKRIALTTW